MSAKAIIIGAYIAAIVAVFLFYPLIVMHGYRQWFVVTFYAVFASAAIGGSISHYRIARRNGGADREHGHHGKAA